ncbi:type II secretion system F family protein [Micromonospora maritima]|uniref:type II secretion system F family protein n=1 Tax=Micromonospora maritima TaxID=986711 RepID=UPI0037897960
MTGQLWLVVVLLTGAATAVAWPTRTGRTRRRVILGQPPGLGRPPAGGRTSPVPDARGGIPVTHPREPRSDSGPISVRWPFRTALPTRHALPVAALLGGGAGMLLGGPVAGLVLAAYGTLGARAVLRRRTRRAADLVHRRDLDRLGAAAADLRAGLPVDGVFDDGPGRTARLARAAARLADRTGAPLAELLERVEADARAADRGLASAAAQAAGARATAWLLAALPLGGIGLGYAIGVDPVAVLLHTPVGGGSAVAAVVLQVGGLLWAERLGAGPGRAA